MDKKRMQEMSGENNTGQAPKLLLNNIRFNGKNGVFVYERVLDGLQEVDGKKTYKKDVIGDTVSLVFLKIRRKLAQFRPGKKSLMTNEHNHPGQKVMLYGDTTEKGVASDLREKYQGLRTNQVVYALYNGELIRLVVKGASLGSEVKPKGVHDFYSYISSFKSGKEDEHFYEYETILTASEELGKLGSYYAMGFAKGEKLPDNVMDEVEKNMETAFNYCTQSDNYYAKFFENDIVPTTEQEIDTIEYPEEDNNVEDIPF